MLPTGRTILLKTSDDESDTGGFVPKLADFNLLRTADIPSSTLFDDPAHLAPEVLKDGVESESAGTRKHATGSHCRDAMRVVKAPTRFAFTLHASPRLTSTENCSCHMTRRRLVFWYSHVGDVHGAEGLRK